MNIQTLTSSKPYNNGYVNACPSDDAGLLKYSSSPPTSRFIGKSSPVKPISSTSMMYSNSQNQQQQQQAYSHQQQNLAYSSDNNNSSTDLQSVVSKYHANPDLLKLILASKVEEDKRRTEEAKLKAKELDLYFQKQQQQELSRKDSSAPTNRNDLHQQQLDAVAAAEQRRRRSSCSSTSSNGSFTAVANTISAADSIHRRIAPYSIPRPIAINNNGTMPRRNSSVSTILNMNKFSIQQQPQMQQQQKIAMASSAPSTSSQYLYSNLSSSNGIRNSTSSDNKSNNSLTQPVKISRRRRSMQALTKIVETTDFPYEDGHFWKNNGNTVQKKTGCKSVYYKCANSCKGCPVNKTVVEQPNGSYLIKYRGDHITECSQVEHIRDL